LLGEQNRGEAMQRYSSGHRTMERIKLPVQHDVYIKLLFPTSYIHSFIHLAARIHVEISVHDIFHIHECTRLYRYSSPSVCFINAKKVEE